MKVKILILVLLWVLTACGVDSFEPIVYLNPPLGLTAQIVSNQILLEFWAFNHEEFFSGFNIFVSDNYEEMLSEKGIKIPNKDGYIDKPTIWENMTKMLEATNILYFVDRDYIDIENEHELQEGRTYFFYIKSFSAELKISSKPSNITNIEYKKSTNN